METIRNVHHVFHIDGNKCLFRCFPAIIGHTDVVKKLKLHHLRETLKLCKSWQ